MDSADASEISKEAYDVIMETISEYYGLSCFAEYGITDWSNLVGLQERTIFIY